MVGHCLVSSIMYSVPVSGGKCDIFFLYVCSLVRGQISASCVYVRDGGWWDIAIVLCHP